MKKLFEEFITCYEERKAAFCIETNPKKSFLKELFSPSTSPKAEEIIDKELEFYKRFEEDIIPTQNLRKKEISPAEWKELIHFLKVHNERLSSQIDNSTTISAMFATLLVILAILANNVAPINWIAFGVTSWVAFQTFSQRIAKRHELSRNKEILAIVEYHIEKIT